MSCGSNPNFNSQTCSNPCLVTTTNTAECESLPSQIENFTDAFFGTVIKTEVDSEVVWSLPCDLDIGLPNNPRAAGEGLACYFLRLFNDGIVGLTGPAGDEGNDGAPGRNAYTVLLSGFNQPDISSPNIQIVTNYNPAILEGMYVFVAESGWYLVTNVNISGALNVTLVRSSGSTAVGVWLSAGKLVVPSGYPGNTVVGPTGAQGIQGPPGSAGTAYTTTSNQINEDSFSGIGSDFDIPGVMTEVDFVGGGSAEVAVQLLSPGKYLLSYSCLVKQAGGTGAPLVETELKEQSGPVIPGSRTSQALTANVDEASTSATAIYYTTGTPYIKLRAKCDLGTGQAFVDYQKVCLNCVKLSSTP